MPDCFCNRRTCDARAQPSAETSSLSIGRPTIALILAAFPVVFYHDTDIPVAMARLCVVTLLLCSLALSASAARLLQQNEAGANMTAASPAPATPPASSSGNATAGNNTFPTIAEALQAANGTGSNITYFIAAVEAAGKLREGGALHSSGNPWAAAHAFHAQQQQLVLRWLAVAGFGPT